MINHFPTQRRAFSTKGRKWRRECVDYICSQADQYHNTNYKRMRENYQMYLDIIDQDDYRSWADPMNLSRGETKDFIHAFNMGHNKIKVLLGEELQRPFQYAAVSLNPEDSNQVIRERNKAYKDYVLFEVQKEIERIQMQEQMKMQAEKQKGLSNSEMRALEEDYQKRMQELEQSIMKPIEIKTRFANYKLPKEKLAHKILKQYELNHKLRFKKNEAWEHFQLSGIEAVMVEEINNEAWITPLNSLGVSYHKGPEEPFIQDGYYASYKREMTVAEVLDRWGDLMASKDRTRLEHLNYASGIDTPLMSKTGFAESHWEHARWTRDMWGTSNIPHEGSYGQSLSPDEYLSVYTVFWRSQRKVFILTTVDEYGNEIEDMLDENFTIPDEALEIKYTDKRGGNKIKYEWDEGKYTVEEQWIPEIWQGTRIEDDIYVNIEPLYYNQPTIQNPTKAKLPIYGIIADAKNGPIVSTWDRIKPWQKMYYFVASKFLKLIAQDRSIVTLLNVLMVDKKIGIEKTMQHLVDNAILPFNPLASEQGARLAHNHKAAEQINLSNTQQITYYAEILRFIEDKIGDAAGIPKPREGQTKQGTNVSDNRQDLVQAATISEAMFYKHELLWEDILNAVLNICVQNIDNKGMINRSILSDEEIAIIENDALSNYDEFDIKISNSRKAYQIIEMAKAHAQALIQNDKVTLSQFMELVGMENVAEFKMYIKEIEANIQEREQQSQQMQFQTQEKIAQMQIEDREDQQEHEWNMQERKYEHEKELKAMDVYTLQQEQDADSDGTPDAIEAYVKMNKVLQDKEKLELEKEKLKYQKEKDDKDRALKRTQKKSS